MGVMTPIMSEAPRDNVQSRNGDFFAAEGNDRRAGETATGPAAQDVRRAEIKYLYTPTVHLNFDGDRETRPFSVDVSTPAGCQ